MWCKLGFRVQGFRVQRFRVAEDRGQRIKERRSEGENIKGWEAGRLEGREAKE